jgi:hypothetical protein
LTVCCLLLGEVISAVKNVIIPALSEDKPFLEQEEATNL